MCLETVMLWAGGNEGWDEGSARVREAATLSARSKNDFPVPLFSLRKILKAISIF